MSGSPARKAHQRRRLYPVIAFALLALVLLVVGCGSSTTTTTSGAVTTAPETATTASGGASTTVAGGATALAVQMMNFSFQPASLTVKVGDTVTWTNNDSTAHTVTADDNSFDSGNIDPGATYKHTFDKAGTVPYHCSIHSSMTGSIVVQ